MCGIFGCVGVNNATETIINGLQNLEYRGYDSAGIAVYDNNKTQIIKCIGSPRNLKKENINFCAEIGIGHTRWATHGSATLNNAHPHKSKQGTFTIVHNGIIENFLQLKESLIDKGYNFTSETDTEVIAHLLEDNYNGDLKGTVKSVLPLLKGSYALGILCVDYPDTIVCARESSPLFVGTAKEEAFISSDVSVISDKSDRLFRLNDGEIGIITKEYFRVYDIDGCRIRKTEIKVRAKENVTNKDGYKHFMLKEIFEQPDVLRRTLSDIISGNKFNFKSIKWYPEEIKAINNVQFVACGSAYHVGLVGSYICEELFKRRAKAEIASEYKYRNPVVDENTLVVIISQSGETADTLAALRLAKERKAKIISVVNVENSSIAIESDCVVLTKAGKEVAVATTKAYSAQLAVIYSLIIHLAYITNEITKEQKEHYINELKSIPEKAESILSESNKLKSYSQKIIGSGFICFIGRNLEYCTALEGSLKLKEISYIPNEAYPSGELKHGTISLIDNKSLTIALSCSKRLREKISSNIREVEARNGNVITITSDNDCGDIKIPETEDIFYPLIEIIPLQLIAYYTADIKGCEIDQPKNLAKSVTVE